ncbi:MPN domain-containing protein [Meloidogyne graminicola]|uniref:26S proteasome non-ATPase regulatory subunit 14 n=1 Tax=Meloidogyne graminicola TaxID=189291 RepID=A0A8S9ZT64_9BILA|nr:MPN domain-containing protein [Meloidogyne graminicola]
MERHRIAGLGGLGLGTPGAGLGTPHDSNQVDTSETVYISSLALLKMLKHGRAGVPMEVMGLMLGDFVDDYTVNVIDVFAMPQSGTGVSVEAVDPVFQAKMIDMLKQTGRPEMVVGWYHSHPGFGCWLSGVDINTQQSFEQLSNRAVAVVVDPIQSVKGKVVIDAFRTISPQTVALQQEPRQTTCNIGHLQKPSIQALIHGLNRHYYSIPIAYRTTENEQQMLLNLNKRSWMDSMMLEKYAIHCSTNQTSVERLLKLSKLYKKVKYNECYELYYEHLWTKSIEEMGKMTDEQIAIKNVGKQDPKRHLGDTVDKLLADNLVQGSAAMLDISVFHLCTKKLRIIRVIHILSGFCTNEVGFLLDTSLCDSSSRNAAIIGNPLRHVSFDDNSETKLLNFTGSANLIDKNCNGKYLSIVSGPNICVFDLHKGAILREFHGHDGAILNVAWHHTNPWLLASVGIDSTLRLWDLRLHPAQLQMRRTPRPFTCLEYSPDCSYIACGGQIISVFDLNMSQSVQYMPCTSPTTNIRFNPAECLLATSHEDHSICFWDIDTGECVTQSPSFDSKVGQICFPPDGKYLIVNNGKKICTIQWEPFQLISQVRDELIFGLSIVNEDSQKIGTACLSTIRLDQLSKVTAQLYPIEYIAKNNFFFSQQKLDCYSTDNSTILDCVEYTSKSIDYENNDFEIQDQFDVTQITAQEKTSAAIIQESSLASDKLVKNVESVEELAPKTLIQNRPTALVLSDNISTSFESAGSICHSSSASARSSIYNLLSPTAIHNKNISSKINCKTIKQQKESLKASTELKSNNLSGKRPNKLPLINQNQQKHLDSYNCHEGQKPR